MIEFQKKLSNKTVIPAVCVFLGTALVSARAQTLSKLRISDPGTALASLGKASTEATEYHAYTVQRWSLANGNDLAVALSSSHKIAFLESDWNGKSDDTSCDLPGLRFGVTTLAELRKRFGSNGFAFKLRGGVIEIEDGVVLVNSYEFGSDVVTFFMKVNEVEYAAAKRSDSHVNVADYARLDAISIASAEYASSEWGDRILDPEYKKAEWK